MDDDAPEAICTLERCVNARDNLQMLLRDTRQRAHDLNNYSKVQAEAETLRLKLASVDAILQEQTQRAIEAINAKEIAEANYKQMQSDWELQRRKVGFLEEKADDSDKHKEQANHWRNKYDEMCCLAEKLEANNIDIKSKYEATVKTLGVVGKKTVSYQNQIAELKASKTESAQKTKKLDKYLKSAIEAIDSLSKNVNLSKQTKTVRDLVNVFRRDDVRLFFNAEPWSSTSSESAGASTSSQPVDNEDEEEEPLPPQDDSLLLASGRRLSDSEDDEIAEDDEDDVEVQKLESMLIKEVVKEGTVKLEVARELTARRGASRIVNAKTVKKWPTGIRKPEAADSGGLLNPKRVHSRQLPTCDFEAIAHATEARKKALLGKTEASGAPSGGTTIHGKKGKTVREQQAEMMKESVKEKAARMKAEAAGPAPQRRTTPRRSTPPRTRHQSFMMSERGSDDSEGEGAVEKEAQEVLEAPAEAPRRRGRPRSTSVHPGSRHDEAPEPRKRMSSSREPPRSDDMEMPPRVLRSASRASTSRASSRRPSPTPSTSSTRGSRARARSILRESQDSEANDLIATAVKSVGRPKRVEPEDEEEEEMDIQLPTPKILEKKKPDDTEPAGDVLKRRLRETIKKRAAPAPINAGPPLRTRGMKRMKAPMVVKKTSEEASKKPQEDDSRFGDISSSSNESFAAPEFDDMPVLSRAPAGADDAHPSTSSKPSEAESSVYENAPEVLFKKPEVVRNLSEASIESSGDIQIVEETAEPLTIDVTEPATEVEPFGAPEFASESSEAPEFAPKAQNASKAAPEGPKSPEPAPETPESLGAPKTTPESSEGPKSAPKPAPEAPESALEGPTVPEAPPEVSEYLRASEAAPNTSKSAPEVPKAPKSAPIALKSALKAQSASKAAPEGPKATEPAPESSEGPKTDPQASETPESAPEAPNVKKALETAPEAPKAAPEAQESAPQAPESSEAPEALKPVPKANPEAPGVPKATKATPKAPESSEDPKSAPQAPEFAPESQKPPARRPSVPLKSPQHKIMIDQLGLDLSDSESDSESPKAPPTISMPAPTPSVSSESTRSQLPVRKEPPKAPPPPVLKPTVSSGSTTSTASSSLVTPLNAHDDLLSDIISGAHMAKKPAPQVKKTTRGRPQQKAQKPVESDSKPPEAPEEDEMAFTISTTPRVSTRKTPPTPVKSTAPKPAAPQKRPADEEATGTPAKRQYTRKTPGIQVIDAIPMKRRRSSTSRSRAASEEPTSSAAAKSSESQVDTVEPTTSSSTATPSDVGKKPGPKKTMMIDVPNRPHGRAIRQEAKVATSKMTSERGGKRVDKNKAHFRQALDLKVGLNELKRQMEDKGIVINDSIPLSPSDAVDVMMEFLRESSPADMWAVLMRQKLAANVAPLVNTEEQNFLQVSASLIAEDNKLLELFIKRILYEMSLRDSLDAKQCGRLVRLFCHAIKFVQHIPEDSEDVSEDPEAILDEKRTSWMRSLFLVLLYQNPVQFPKAFAYCLISDVSAYCQLLVDELEKPVTSSELHVAIRILMYKETDQAAVINWLLNTKYQMAYIQPMAPEDVQKACHIAHRKFLEDEVSGMKTSVFLAKTADHEVLKVAFRILQENMTLIEKQFLAPKEKDQELKHRTAYNVPTVATKMSASEAHTLMRVVEWEKIMMSVMIDNPMSTHYQEIMKALTMVTEQIVAFREIVESSDIEQYVDASGVESLHQAVQHFLELTSEFTNFPLKPSTLDSQKPSSST